MRYLKTDFGKVQILLMMRQAKTVKVAGQGQETERTEKQRTDLGMLNH